jgi:isoquinoline 1-oxidoreductase beta subunit
MQTQISRRDFLKVSAATSASLFIGLNAKGLLAAGNADQVLNHFVRIDADGMVTVIIKHFEMGQGTTTGLATLVAEELDADWAQIRTEFAPSDNAKYKNFLFGSQGTGGSTAIANSFMQYRQAGASARNLLVRAAAKAWGVKENAIRVSQGTITDGKHQSGFGQFIQAAASLEPLAEPALKSPAQFQLIGKQKLHRKDNTDKTNGTATFAMDVQLPGMVYAVILRSPRFAGVVKSFDDSAAKQVSGFIGVKLLPNKSGIVVYGKNTWAALQARKAIDVAWDEQAAEKRSTPEMVDEHRKLLVEPMYQAVKAHSTAAASAAIKQAGKTIAAEFVFPLLAHAPMEPLVCVLEPTTEGVTLHDGCQFPAMAHGAVAGVLGLDATQVKINTLYAGGSFGRRATPTADYQIEAAHAFNLLGQKVPVKLVWSREDDIQGGYYRPMAVHQVKIGLDSKQHIQAWNHRVASKSIVKGTALEGVMVHDGVDHTSVEGIADTLYKLPGMAVGVSDFTTPMPVLWWRSVGHSHTAYVMESLLDMLAHAAKQDPIAYRLSLLDESDAKHKRFADVMRSVQKLSAWQPGQKRGFAAHYSFNSYVAVVADVSVNNKQVHVDKIYMAVDCGIAVNPDIIKAQMEGGAGFALGAIMRNEITLKDGQVQQSNFPDYAPLRIGDMPAIEVAITPSAEAPTGVGEPGVPPIGPAIANALFTITGERVTELPLTKAGFVFV